MVVEGKAPVRASDGQPPRRGAQRWLGAGAATAVGLAALGLVAAAFMVLVVYVFFSAIAMLFVGPAGPIFMARMLFGRELLELCAAIGAVVAPLTIYAAWSARHRTPRCDDSGDDRQGTADVAGRT